MDNRNVRYKTLVDLSRILALFEQDPSERAVSDIARTLDMLPSKVSRMLRTLELEGLVERNPKTGKYRIGARFLHLGLQFLLAHPLRRTILPHVEQTARELGVLTSWGIFTQHRVIIVDRVTVDLDYTVHLIGSEMPLHSSSYGKLFLAYLPPDRQRELLQGIDYKPLTPNTLTTPAALRRELSVILERGYAIDREESRIGVVAISSPVFDESETICAAITIAFRITRNLDEMKATSYLRSKCNFVSRQLGSTSAPVTLEAEGAEIKRIFPK